MTLFLLLLDAVLTALAGAAVVGLVPARLTILERCAIGVVAGVVLSSAATFGLALVAGLNISTVLAGPLWIIVLASLAARFAGNPYTLWRTEVAAAVARWRARPPIAMVAITVVTAVLATLIYAHTVYLQDGNVFAGYETVWADWSQHLTTASSFALGQNLPPTNPLFSGTPLLYPFLPDFHGATLIALGVSAGPALALGSGVLAVTLVLLVIALARRLGIGLGGAVVAAAICLIGGGVGFIGLFRDACTAGGTVAANCNLGFIITHLGDAPGIVGSTLTHLPGIIAAQPHAYDGLLTSASDQAFANQQWYTPLFSWWLPQRSMLYGFDLAVAVLLLVLTALQSRAPQWAAFAVSGVLIGVLPLVHAQSLFVLAVLLLVLGLRHGRREWLVLIGVALVLAAPRLVQIAFAAHGAKSAGNLYPYIQPGWKANDNLHLDLTPRNLVDGTLQSLGYLGTGSWWGFWLANLGAALPLCIVVTLGALARFAGGGVQQLGMRVTGFAGASLLELLAGAMVIFALCDVIVFQSWDWDNTKLYVYWYLIAGLLAAALASHWWRRGSWRTLAAVLLPGSMLLTGLIVMLRLLPWTPAADQVTGPYTVASGDEVAMAAQLVRATPGDAVFLTFGRPNDPLLAVAGRTGVMGYYGWLWSYGIDFGTRVQDVISMYAGCSNGAPCQVVPLLHQYHVSYVEIDDRVTDSGAITSSVNAAWWAAQGYPVVARSQHITVYDVRGA